MRGSSAMPGGVGNVSSSTDQIWRLRGAWSRLILVAFFSTVALV